MQLKTLIKNWLGLEDASELKQKIVELNEKIELIEKAVAIVIVNVETIGEITDENSEFLELHQAALIENELIAMVDDEDEEGNQTPPNPQTLN